VVGAGIAGLSTALEAAQREARVTVIEMSSVFGGHAVVSGLDPLAGVRRVVGASGALGDASSAVGGALRVD